MFKYAGVQVWPRFFSLRFLGVEALPWRILVDVCADALNCAIAFVFESWKCQRWPFLLLQDLVVSASIEAAKSYWLNFTTRTISLAWPSWVDMFQGRISAIGWSTKRASFALSVQAQPVASMLASTSWLSSSMQACWSTWHSNFIRLRRSTADNSLFVSHSRHVLRWQLPVWPLRTSNMAASFGLMFWTLRWIDAGMQEQ